MGCGQPGGEAGYNIGRVVAILAGMPDVPGVTVNRYCSSSLQTIRMAAHAIKAGEGDVFIAAGVETVSRYMNGAADTGPHNPRFADAEARTAEPHRRRPGRRGRRPRACPTSTSPWARPPRTWPSSRTCRREEMDEFAALSQQRATASLERGFFEREITPITTPDGTVVSKDDGIRPGTTVEGLAEPQAGVPPRRQGHRRQRLPAQRRRRRGDRHERHPGRRARPHAAGPHRGQRRHRPQPRDHGPRARSRPAARRWPAPA